MNYEYQAYTQDMKLSRGSVSATDEKAANQTLATMGLNLLSLKPELPRLFSLKMNLPFVSKVGPADVVTFSRQMAVLLRSGISVTRALDLLARQATNKALRETLNQVSSDIRGGASFSAALGRHPRVFPAIYPKLVSVGEQTGGLDGILKQLADYIERQHITISKVKMALAYPTLVLILGAVMGLILTTVALPPIVGLFTNFGANLPLPTRLLLLFANFQRHYWVWVVLSIGVLVIGGILYGRTARGRYQLHKLVLRLPLVGRLILLSELGRCSRCMSLMFHAGVPAHGVLALAIQVSGNQVVRRSLEGVGQAVVKGEGLSLPMSRDPVFLPLMVEMAKVGEETGNPDETFQTVAADYEVEVEERTRRLIGLIEPTMTVAMGLMVGFIALSIFMPIYGMLGALR